MDGLDDYITDLRENYCSCGAEISTHARRCDDCLRRADEQQEFEHSEDY